MAMPCGSWIVIRSTGGRSQPVSQGDTTRTSQPLGAAMNAKPTATATCGVASMGDTQATSRWNRGCCDAIAQNPNARPSDNTVAVTPV